MEKITGFIFVCLLFIGAYMLSGWLFHLVWNAGLFPAGLVDREIDTMTAVCVLFAVSFLGGSWTMMKRISQKQGD